MVEIGKRLLVAVLIAGILAPTFTAMTAQSASPADFAIPGGHFYTQAGGSADQSRGFGITDGGGVPFRAEFTAQGGVPALGYPASRRFVLNGFTAQATQKAILQWMPGENRVVAANVFDLLHDRGLDPWLQAQRQIPPPFDTSPDTGLPFDQVVRRHLAFLDISPAIKARYLSDSDPLLHFGLPMSYVDLGSVVVVRAQRAAFQEWRVNTPWAKAGSVTLTNSGDIAKETGLVPSDAAVPEGPGQDGMLIAGGGSAAPGAVGAGSAGIHTRAAAPWATGPRSGPIPSGLIANYGEVSAGILYRSAQPEGKDYRWLLDRGFKSIISFRRETGDTTSAVLNQGFRNYLWLSVEDETDPTDAQAEEFLNFVLDSRNWPILVHCKVGLGRTGTFVALVRYAVDGWTMDEAINEAKLYRGGVDLIQSQTDWLRAWEAKHPRGCHRPAKV